MHQHSQNDPQRSPSLWPQADVRTQLAGSALMWLIGASILLVRGAAYIQGRSWHAFALAAGLALGVIKSRYLLEGVAERAVVRIREQGRTWLPGFFSLRSWALVALMMGGGMLLRRIVVAPDQIGAGILGAVYIGVGAALLLADRVFWHAVFGRSRNGTVL
ncbi:MAG: hypothetical protein RBS17_04110 [Coriobacteriia bacterium]|nr:hypothetical protein [Coriobacteriia bacterium]